jgi:hypothetical protein
MGTWGPALFDDDDAADLREDYSVFLADAQSDAGATDAAAKDYGARLDALADTTAFWLALAAIQWRIGRLDPRVKTAALRIIDDGLDLAKWEGSPYLRCRATVLRKLRRTITSDPPAPKPLPKPLPIQLPGWEFSEIVGHRLENKKYVLLHVLGYHAWTTLSVKALVTILNWFSEDVPNSTDVQALRFINHNGEIGGHHLWCLAMPKNKALKAEQFDRLGWRMPVTEAEASSAICGLSAHEGGTLERALRKVLWPYWQDPRRPAHMPKVLPAGLSEAEAHKMWEELHRRLFGSDWQAH